MSLIKVKGSTWDSADNGLGVNVKDYGADPTGATVTSNEIQAAIDAANGIIYFPPGTYLLDTAIAIPSNTKVIGSGIGNTIIKHPSSFGFINSGKAGGTSNTHITIEGFTFDSDETFDGGISVNAVNNFIVKECEFKNLKPIGVTVGIGYGTLITEPSENVIISDCIFDVPDYGIVFECSTGKANLSNITISNCVIRTAWGSGISLSGDISNTTISNCVFELPGNGNFELLPTDPNYYESRVGIGIKLWQGSDQYAAPETITISGCVFRGANDTYQDWTPWVTATGYVVGDWVSNGKRNYVCKVAHTSGATTEPGVGVSYADYWSTAGLFGVSAANWTNELSCTGNSFRWLTFAFYNNYAGSNSDTLIFSSNAVEYTYYGYFNDISSDSMPVISGNAFRYVDTGIRSSLRFATVTGNQFRDIVSKGIYCNSPSENASITGNTFFTVGEEFIYIAGIGASNNGIIIANNNMSYSSTKGNGLYNSIEIQGTDFILNGNWISNENASVQPNYIIGRPSPNDNNSIITGNWFYGAVTGYQENTGVADIYANNRERGL